MTGGTVRDLLSLMDTNTSSTGVARAIAAQYACIGALRQIGDCLHRSHDGAAGVAVGARPLHQLCVLRWPGSAHPYALVCPVVLGCLRLRRQTCGATTGWETAVDAALSPSREAVAPGDILKVRWMAAEGDDKVYRMSS